MSFAGFTPEAPSRLAKKPIGWKVKGERGRDPQLFKILSFFKISKKFKKIQKNCSFRIFEGEPSPAFLALFDSF
jgi:hypothetical protein